MMSQRGLGLRARAGSMAISAYFRERGVQWATAERKLDGIGDGEEQVTAHLCVVISKLGGQIDGRYVAW